MDDLPDKLRRNVVVLSAAIVAINIFDLSFKPSGMLLGFAEVGHVTPLKAWLALSAVLVYMFLRYWFYEDTDQELTLLAQEFQNRRYAAIKGYLEYTLERYLIYKRAPSRLANFDGFSDDQLTERFADRGPIARATVTASVELDKNSPWQGEVGYSFELKWADGNHYRSSGGQRLGFDLTRRFAVWTVLRCASSTAIYSKSAVDVLVPIALAAVAATICLYQLAMAGLQP
ncbi:MULTISPECIES: hypothetical protein [Paraburkholderia]|uniref:Uncharacterized protein n=1 Tax=Paraburkholderia madseniana TaxID=2599607 RepID=A0AAP5BHN8_9BURK|nr:MULTISPECIES: hypothetical protein [Paraburkholderia]MCX4149935.1 hypothetical protein [Paraburkholderia madseniana]MDN7152871.1 hypothetical protein [Paraburkholderia sp. WS6]MDQ6411753.1 hypothetical protein [Paraburkholderia madseniana]